MTVVAPERCSKASRGLWKRGLALFAAVLAVSAFAAPALAEGVQVGMGPSAVSISTPAAVGTEPVQMSVQTPVGDANVAASPATLAVDQSTGSLPVAAVSSPTIDARVSTPVATAAVAVRPGRVRASSQVKGITTAGAADPQSAAVPQAQTLRAPAATTRMKRVAAAPRHVPVPPRALVLTPSPGPAVPQAQVAGLFDASATAPAAQRRVARAHDSVSTLRSGWGALIRAATSAGGVVRSAGGTGSGLVALVGLVLLLSIGGSRLVSVPLSDPGPARPALALERPG
jgi:hypothetical protein